MARFACWLDGQKNWNNYGSLGGFLHQELADIISDIGFDIVDIYRIHAFRRIFDCILYDYTSLMEKLL